MGTLVELIARLNWFERADELIRSVTGTASWRLAVPRACGWSGRDMEQLLRRHGVRIWGRNFDRHHLYFRVKLEQANWAEYLLWRRGIPVVSPPFNPMNRSYGLRHAPGSEPGASNRRQPNLIEDLLSRLF